MMITYGEPRKGAICSNCDDEAEKILVFTNVFNKNFTVKLCGSCLYELDERTRAELLKEGAE
ncbi:hypothetical protein MOB89_08005 [Bacillus inaquosorum]|uniref:hypothetical protein n=1 Tax=Bacillus inaquosorum TaxID=483913 RepID=UPI00227F073F|nr:hypothetical protein [Bacillus inaquosorum]MCY7983376.1 hypothetical protein [Bacillus inaquosorum]